MARDLYNITSVTATTLVERNIDRGGVKLVKLTNTSAADVVVELYLLDSSSTKFYIAKTTIPSNVGLELNSGLSFNGSLYSLVLNVTSGGSLSSSTPQTAKKR